MKTLKCSDLGGPSDCQHEVSAESVEELGNNCKAHVMDMVGKGDEAHQAAINDMMAKSPEEQQVAFAAFAKKYEDAPEV